MVWRLTAVAAMWVLGALPAHAQVAPATGVTITASLPSPQLVGTPVVYTAAGIGSSGYQYRFFYRNWNDTAYTLAQDWSATSTWTLPTTLAAGSYTIVTHVRTGTGAFEAQAWTHMALATPPPPPATGVTITASLPSPQVAGTPVVYTAAGIGSSGYQYQFFYRNWNSPTFVLAQDWSATSTWTVPATFVPGSYTIVTHVRTGTGAFEAQAWTYLTLTAPAPPPATGVTLTASLPSPQVVGTPVAYTAAGIGSSGYQYQFFYRNWNSTIYTLAQDWSALDTWTLPATLAPGSYTIVTHVRTGTGPFEAQAWTHITLDPLPPPTVGSLTPAGGPAAGGTAVTLAGTGFVPGATVTFGGSLATVSASSATSLTVTTPAHAAGAVDVVVRNPDGQAATLTGGYAYAPAPVVLPAPAIASVSPSSGPDTGGVAVSVTGANFVTGTVVTFGGVPATLVSLTPTLLGLATPPHAVGVVDVTVRNPDGQTATMPAAYNFIGAPPVISTLNVHGCPPAGGTTVLIAGTGLQAGATVTFGGVTATSVSYDAINKVLNVTTPAFPLPAGATEATVDVVVTNPDGQTALFPGFHYGPPPVAQSFTPTALNNGKAGQLITVTGTDFETVRGIQVSFSGFVGTVVAKTSTQLVVGIPKLNPGVFQVIVTNFDGQFSVAPGTLFVAGP